MNRIFRIKEIDGNTDFQNVTLAISSLKLNKILDFVRLIPLEIDSV
jgi:hypothetical protein